VAPLDLLELVLAALVGVLFTAGFAIPTLVPPPKARFCFVAGGVAAWGMIVIAGYLLNASLWQRLLITGLFGAISAAGASEAYRWASPKEEAKMAPARPPETATPAVQEPVADQKAMTKPNRPAPIVSFSDRVRGRVELSLSAQTTPEEAPYVVALYGNQQTMTEQLMMYMEGKVRDEMIKYTLEDARRNRKKIAKSILTSAQKEVETRFHTVLHGVTIGEIWKLTN
jgi:hypothetical protein